MWMVVPTGEREREEGVTLIRTQAEPDKTHHSIPPVAFSPSLSQRRPGTQGGGLANRDCGSRTRVGSPNLARPAEGEGGDRASEVRVGGVFSSKGSEETPKA